MHQVLYIVQYLVHYDMPCDPNIVHLPNELSLEFTCLSGLVALHCLLVVPSLLSCLGGLVEHQPCKLEIAGSSPAQGSSFSLKLDVCIECFSLLCLELLHVTALL